MFLLLIFAVPKEPMRFFNSGVEVRDDGFPIRSDHDGRHYAQANPSSPRTMGTSANFELHPAGGGGLAKFKYCQSPLTKLPAASPSMDSRCGPQADGSDGTNTAKSCSIFDR